MHLYSPEEQESTWGVPDPKRGAGGGEGQKTNFYPKHLQGERSSSRGSHPQRGGSNLDKG